MISFNFIWHNFERTHAVMSFIYTELSVDSQSTFKTTFIPLKIISHVVIIILVILNIYLIWHFLFPEKSYFHTSSLFMIFKLLFHRQTKKTRALKASKDYSQCFEKTKVTRAFSYQRPESNNTGKSKQTFQRLTKIRIKWCIMVSWTIDSWC